MKAVIVGLRQAFDRWRARPTDDAGSDAGGSFDSAFFPAQPDGPGDGLPAPRHEMAPPPVPGPPDTAAGRLVVGRTPAPLPSAVPGFYRASDAEPTAARSSPEPPATSPAPARPGPAARPLTADPGPQRAEERALVRQAWELVADRPDELVRVFYAELFYSLGDQAFAMFPAGMAQQRTDFGRALVQWVTADDPESLSAHLEQLGADHRKFDVEPQHYEVVGQALVTAWSRLAGDRLTVEMERALIGCYVRLATIMLDGALRHSDEPKSWGATVIGHQRLLPDFAVITVQPDAPYGFVAGQYVTLELAALPKLWRSMSVASAPRPDNTFDLQVRAVSGTGVSGALVMHTSVGDRLRLGPPRGTSLVLGAQLAPGGVVCVCSGTGAAPVTAIVEALVSRPEPPEVRAFIGARDAANLHAVDHLSKLVAAAGRADRVRVHGVAPDGEGCADYHGRVEQVMPRLRDWAGLDADYLLAGPDAMMAATVAGLRAVGVPESRIRFDQYDLPA